MSTEYDKAIASQFQDDPHIIIYGDISEGIRCAEGPFETFEEALKFAENQSESPYHLIPITKPEE